jgi:hypothetical protein
MSAAVNRLTLELDDSTLSWLRALARANGTSAPALLEYMATALANYAGRSPDDSAKHVAVLLVRAGLDEVIPLLDRHNCKNADILRAGQKLKSPAIGNGVAP